jgi:hypothetical protein
VTLILSFSIINLFAVEIPTAEDPYLPIDMMENVAEVLGVIETDFVSTQNYNTANEDAYKALLEAAKEQYGEQVEIGDIVWVSPELEAYNAKQNQQSAEVAAQVGNNVGKGIGKGLMGAAKGGGLKSLGKEAVKVGTDTAIRTGVNATAQAIDDAVSRFAFKATGKVIVLIITEELD